MLTRCHSCGATASLDVLVTNEDTKAALKAVFALSNELGDSMIRYLALFRPARRVLTHARMATLLGEVQPYLTGGAIPRKGRDWPVAVADWVQAVELTLQARDAGKLTLPLTSHGYLLEVLSSIADRAERIHEDAIHAERLARADVPATAATVTVRGQTMSIGQGLAQVYGGRDPALAKLDADRHNKKGMPAEFKANLAALRAGTYKSKE